MKKTPVFLITAFLLLSIIGCNPTNNPNVTPTVPDSISGYLVCQKLTLDTFTNIDDEQAIAVFFTSPGGTITTLADGVTLNNDSLEVDIDSINSYLLLESIGSGLEVNFDTGAHWSVAGANGIPSFSYNHAVPYPGFSAAIPDTVDKSNGFSFNFSTTGADSVFVTFGSDSLGNPVTKHYVASSGSISFSSSDLASILTMDSYLSIYVYKRTTQTFSNKKFLFAKILNVNKYMWVTD